MSEGEDDELLGEEDNFDMNSGSSDNQQVLNLDGDDSDDNNQEQEDDYEPKMSHQGKNPLPDTEKVENQPFDEAVEINDSEELDSDEDEEPMMQNQQNMAGQNEQYYDEAPPPAGAYNPADYKNLNVDDDVRELFDYIGRYKPQHIDLETKFKPFIPDYIPAVGEVDAFLKMKKPNGEDEDLGITVLDEPALNQSDVKVLEMKYIQTKKTTVVPTDVTVGAVKNAEKNTKEIQNWINNVNSLHKGRPPATVNYTKAMPDFDLLMEEWPPAMERALREIEFPTPEIALSTLDYARVMLAMLGIPVHNTPNEKGVIEGLHVMLTLLSEFRENQHIRQLGAQNQAF